MKRLRGLLKNWEVILLLLLASEFIIFTLANPKFLNPVSILSSITNYIGICIIALFVTFVMITGGIDIQAPSIIGLTSITIGVLWSDAGFNIWVAVFAAIVLSALCGALSGFFVAYCDVQPMVVTLGGSFLYSGLALLIFQHVQDPGVSGHQQIPYEDGSGRVRIVQIFRKRHDIRIPADACIHLHSADSDLLVLATQD